MYELAKRYRDRGMSAYAQLQEAEFRSEAEGYSAVRHQHEVGTSYFDAVSVAISGGQSSTTAMASSTEAQQFQAASQPNGYATRSLHLTERGSGVPHLDAMRVVEELRKEAYYFRAKEVYKEIEEFAWNDDDY
jgi:isocitrate lyase